MDPTKVVKNSLRYASGLASILLTAEVAVIDDYSKNIRIHEEIKI